jgi:hypothetical protein
MPFLGQFRVLNRLFHRRQFVCIPNHLDLARGNYYEERTANGSRPSAVFLTLRNLDVAPKLDRGAWLHHCRGIFFGLVSMALCVVARGQTNSAAALRYADGYVGIDISGSGDGLTWYWGYDSPGQLTADGSLLLHTTRVHDSSTLEIVTDTYSVAGITAPPAPYSGTYTGPGPLIPLASTRVVTLAPAPKLQITLASSNVVVSWPVTSYDFVLQSSTNPAIPTAWKSATKTPTVIGGQNTYTTSTATGILYYRLILTLP